MVDLQKHAEQVHKKLNCFGLESTPEHRVIGLHYPVSVSIIMEALLTAYNEGAGQFRERAAKLCDTFKSASSPSAIGNQIRALPLTEGEP